jgi:hypothetical protein
MEDWSAEMAGPSHFVVFKMDDDDSEENDVELELELLQGQAGTHPGFCPLASWNAERPHCGLGKDPSFSCQVQSSRRVYTDAQGSSSLPPQPPSTMHGRPREGGGGAFLGFPPKRQRTVHAQGLPVPGFAGPGFRVPSPLAASASWGMPPQHVRAPSPFAHGSPCNSTPSPTAGGLGNASPHLTGLLGSRSMSPLKYVLR